MDEGFEHLEANGARLKHVDALNRYPVPRSRFDRALLTLLQLSPHLGIDGTRDGRRAAMRAALDNLASYDSIRHWRRGTRRPPQWAKDLLAAKIAKRRQLDASGESDARAA